MRIALCVRGQSCVCARVWPHTSMCVHACVRARGCREGSLSCVTGGVLAGLQTALSAKQPRKRYFRGLRLSTGPSVVMGHVFLAKTVPSICWGFCADLAGGGACWILPGSSRSVCWMSVACHNIVSMLHFAFSDETPHDSYPAPAPSPLSCLHTRGESDTQRRPCGTTLSTSRRAKLMERRTIIPWAQRVSVTVGTWRCAHQVRCRVESPPTRTCTRTNTRTHAHTGTPPAPTLPSTGTLPLAQKNCRHL